MRRRCDKSPPSVFVTTEEIALAVALVSQLDPEQYVHPEAKALIYKTKALMQKTADA